MSGHLAHAGFPLSIYDVSDRAMEQLKSNHPDITTCDSPADVGAQSDIVITMLPDGAQVQKAAIGSDGLINSMKEGSILLDTSSAQPWLTIETAAKLATKGIEMIDAPVSGAQWGAEEANLVFMVGGSLQNVEIVRPILDLLGRAVFHCGPLGSGHIMKCINNTITAMTFLATVEGLILGKRAGLDPAAMNKVLNESTGGSWITLNHIEQRILSRTFDDPFRLELMLKDINIAGNLARNLELPTSFFNHGAQVYESADEHAGPGKSLSELARWIEKLSQVDITPGPLSA